MNKYAVDHYFDAHPTLKECFETPEGVIHPLLSEAERWVKNSTNKNIITHKNPAFENEKEGNDAAAEKQLQIKNVTVELDFLKQQVADFKTANPADLTKEQKAELSNLEKAVKAKEKELSKLEK